MRIQSLALFVLSFSVSTRTASCTVTTAESKLPTRGTSFLRSHRRLKQDEQESPAEFSAPEDDDDVLASPSESSTNARSVSISFSVLALEYNSTTPRLQQLRAPVVECALTNLLCLETDLTLTAVDSADGNGDKRSDPCYDIRASGSPPQAIFANKTSDVTIPAQAFVDRSHIERRNGLSYLEWTLSYQAIFDEDTPRLTMEQDAVELKALVQFATDVNIQDGTMDMLLKYCYKQSRQDDGDDASRRPKLDIHSSVMGDELETFNDYATTTSTTATTSEDLPAWQQWFAQQDRTLLIGLAILAGVLVTLAFCLFLALGRRANRETNLDHADAKLKTNSLAKPIPFAKASTIATVKHMDNSDDDGEDNDDVVLFHEDDLSQSQAARVMEMLEQGSESSVNFDEGDFSLCDERDYEKGRASPAVFASCFGHMPSEDQDDELADNDYDGEDLLSSDQPSTRPFVAASSSQGVSDIALLESSQMPVNSVLLQWHTHASEGDAEVSCDDTVSDASQGYASDGDEGLAPPTHEEDESSTATCRVLNTSSSLDGRRTKMDVKVTHPFKNVEFVRSKSMNSRTIFRAAPASNGKIHVIKDLDSGRIMPLETAASF